MSLLRLTLPTLLLAASLTACATADDVDDPAGLTVPTCEPTSAALEGDFDVVDLHPSEYAIETASAGRSLEPRFDPQVLAEGRPDRDPRPHFDPSDLRPHRNPGPHFDPSDLEIARQFDATFDPVVYDPALDPSVDDAAAAVCLCADSQCVVDWVDENLGCNLCAVITCGDASAVHACVACPLPDADDDVDEAEIAHPETCVYPQITENAPIWK